MATRPYPILTVNEKAARAIRRASWVYGGGDHRSRPAL